MIFTKSLDEVLNTPSVIFHCHPLANLHEILLDEWVFMRSIQVAGIVAQVAPHAVLLRLLPQPTTEWLVPVELSP